jgi:plasmid maintenance system antidote protein VapI
MQLYKDIAKVPKKQLAKIWGQEASNLYKYLNGSRSLTPSLARKIAISFNMPEDLLLRVDAANTKAQFKQLQEKEPAEQYTPAHILKQSA